jgi:hypothetical protein
MNRHRPSSFSHSLRSAFLVLVACALAPSFAAATPATVVRQVLAVDRVGESPDLCPAADLLAVEWRTRESDGADVLRLSFLSLREDAPGGLARAFVASGRPAEVAVTVQARSAKAAAPAPATLRLVRGGRAYAAQPPADAGKALAREVFTVDGDPDAIYVVLAEDFRPGDGPWSLDVTTATTGRGDVVTASLPADKAISANCAFVLHGNQGIGYTDVLNGRADDLDGSGFDEALQVHEGTGVPGNFHVSGTLMTAAEWSARNGNPMDFNAWLASGASAGWAGMITSAYGQHIMPFVQDPMNSWAVNIQAQMVAARYGYTPRVAWVPERVWLNTSGYPSSGVSDWIGDNWQAHGVWGVILDDDVHLAGHDNHQIHFLNANGLRLIPRDRSFTGNIIGGNGQAALDILSGLAGSGVGAYRIAVFAEDWEAASEMGGWASITPNAKETYDWIIGKCSTESAWLATWKLADALTNPGFNGSSIDVTPGTYNEIGGFDGYGGGDNGWYGHWAGYVPYANGGDGYGNCAGGGGNCKNYGTLWNDAYNALLGAPDNNIAQAGWYVLMTNLHETAWHDGLGGDISGWQHKYSSHMKNAMIYAEAAHWAAGEYVVATNAYAGDIDNDGYDELIIHNDRLFGVIEGAGGRLTHLFVRGPGYDDTAIGVDNAYWSGTEGDFNDDNHVGALSDVSPNYQSDGYAWSIGAVDPAGPSVTVSLSRGEVTKELKLTEGDSFFDVVYRVGPTTHWIQAGFSPSLVDLVWNAELDRVWAPDASYMGFRNPNTGVAAAFLLGAGGAAHQKEISGTLMKGDEVRGSGVFQMQLFAGPTSAPDGSGDIAELRALADAVADTIGPAFTGAQFYPQSGRLAISVDQPAYIDPAGFTVVGSSDPVDIPVQTLIAETPPALTLTLLLDAETSDAVAALAALGPIHLTAVAGAVVDDAGNDNVQLFAPDLEIEVQDTAVTIDGHVETAEWESAQALADSNDSAWTAANEIDRLLVRWDADYLYLAIDGQVSGNSWLLYLDVDPGGAGGQTDLTAINYWERGASFSAPAFAPDFQYGCYQHQSIYDGDGFFELTSPTVAVDRSDEILSAFDSFHTFGDASGSELAIPWHTLYGLGAGAVPAGAQIALAAAVCWDPEPAGELGGDVAPNNVAAALPVIDNAWTLTVDADGNGLPDTGTSPVPDVRAPGLRLLPNTPNPFNPQTTLAFEVPGEAPAAVSLVVYDLRGRVVRRLVEGSLQPGRHTRVWDGRDDGGRTVAASTYLVRLESGGEVLTRPVALVK